MFDRYFVTGGTGFLGRAVLQKLAGAGAAVRALVLPGDPLLPLLPPDSFQIIPFFKISNAGNPKVSGIINSKN